MKIELSPEAVERLKAQIAYLRTAEVFQAAERLRIRVMDFLSSHLAHAGWRSVTCGRRGFHERVWCFGIELNMSAFWL